MNISEQPQTFTTQHEVAIFPVTIQEEGVDMEGTSSSEKNTRKVSLSTAILPGDPLAMLEARMTNMSSKIAELNSKVAVLHSFIAGRELRITSLEKERNDLEQQLEAYSSTHSQMVDGLSKLLERFPEDAEKSEKMDQHFTSVDTSLLDETVGTA